MLNIPLMSNNISKEDVGELITFLESSDHFTNGPKVREFEEAWNAWGGGVKHSLFVNSGSSANFMTMAGIAHLYGTGEVIVPAVTWSSDISSVIMAGHTPVFVDVSFSNIAMQEEAILSHITKNTKAVFLSHILGFNGLRKNLVKELERCNVLLVEDVCESHGAVFDGKKAGTIGFASNFSFYYAHHMSTIEGGMICTDNREFYEIMRMYRSHGMLRECTDEQYIDKIVAEYPKLHKEFIFTVPGFNMRSTELNAIIGLNQLKRLDLNILQRKENFTFFMENLDSGKYYTDFDMEGNSNYAFVILLREKNDKLYNRMLSALVDEKVEFRRGTAGGGNMVRQPFVRERYPYLNPKDFPNAEHIHFYGLYTGNYPGLEKEKIAGLCKVLNAL
ncbi:DegT/DnrJ/EryC1/StrS aminotransferase family protein [bacterium D16-59]|nr:DegT/DnrJ/EryC1/StrS aminotransferase family protein [bacterium D16-59]